MGLLLTCLLLGAASPDSARAPSPVLTLPAVEVRRDAVTAGARRRAPTTFASDLPLRAHGRAVERLEDVLASAAGARVVQYGGLGTFSTVALRGGSPGQVTIVLDGVPVTSAAQSVVDVSSLPAGVVDRIEVYRGTTPLAFGPATPGGALQLVTRATAEPPRIRLAAGSFGTFESSASAGAERGPFALVVHGATSGAKGDFDYFDDNGTPFNPGDDSTSVRRNNRFDAATGFAALGWRAPHAVRVRATANVFRRANGLPGIGAVPALNPRQSFERTHVALEAAREATAARPGLVVRAGLQRERRRLRDREGQLGLGRQNVDLGFTGETASLETMTPAWTRARLNAGAAWRAERQSGAAATIGFATPPDSRRITRAAWVGAEFQPLGPNALLVVGQRWDEQADQLRSAAAVGPSIVSRDAGRALASPRAGARIRLPAGFELRANAARAERAPDFLELFGEPGLVQGNATLRPESADLADVGGAWLVERGALAARLEFAHHRAWVTDLIAFQRSGANTVRALNVSRARIRGDELTGTLAVGRAWRASGSMTWQGAYDDGASPLYRGRRLPQRPARQAYARLTWAHAGWALTSDVHAIGDNFLDPANRTRVPDRTLLGVGLSHAWLGGALRLAFDVQNLGDRRVADVAGFPLPGRTFFASCEARLGPTD